MSVGLGVFLAGLSIGVALLLLNPDTRAVIGKGFVWLLAISVVAGVAFFLYIKHDEDNKKQIESNPSLAGIKLLESKIDVIYKLGNASNQIDSTLYFDEKNLAVSFENNAANYVLVSCKNNSGFPSLNGIYCNDSSNQIKNRFKEKAVELCLLDSPTERLYLVKEFNLMYVLAKDKVFLLALRKGDADYKLNWISCGAAKYFD